MAQTVSLFTSWMRIPPDISGYMTDIKKVFQRLNQHEAVIALFCRQYDIIKDNDSSNNKDKVKPSSERSTPEHHSGGLLRSKFHPSVPSINIIEV